MPLLIEHRDQTTVRLVPNDLRSVRWVAKDVLLDEESHLTRDRAQELLEKMYLKGLEHGLAHMLQATRPGAQLEIVYPNEQLAKAA